MKVLKSGNAVVYTERKCSCSKCGAQLAVHDTDVEIGSDRDGAFAKFDCPECKYPNMIELSVWHALPKYKER